MRIIKINEDLILETQLEDYITANSKFDSYSETETNIVWTNGEGHSGEVNIYIESVNGLCDLLQGTFRRAWSED